MLRIPRTIINGRSRSHTRRWLTAALLWCITIYGIAPVIIQAQTEVNGNIAPNKIEIDQYANVTRDPGVPTILNFNRDGDPVDWKKDDLPNTDRYPTGAPFLQGGVAVGINSDPLQGTVTGAVGGMGHWYGGRIVDGIGGAELDQFTMGGKVYDPSTWSINPGSIGSAKYDASQAYMANNRSDIFFGMERSGNNGTTAFDFEFNQNPPLLTDPRNVPTTYIPNRRPGDVLISYELQGSGGASGTVATFYYVYDGTNFVLCGSGGGVPCPANLFSSINGPVDNTPSPPWGHVDSHRDWVLSPIERRLFAEASVPLTALPGVNTCGGALFVQIRTRSSSSLGSDAKDTTPIFKYIFGGPTARGGLSKTCGLSIGYNGSASTNSAGGTDNLTYSWQFQKNSAADGSGTWSNVGSPQTGVSGNFNANAFGEGRYQAILTITEGGGCTDVKTSAPVNIYTDVGGSASITPDCDDTFAYAASATGGKAPYTFRWTISKSLGAPGPADDLVAKTFMDIGTSSGNLDVDNFNAGANGDGNYYAVVTITDSENCSFPVNVPAIDVRHPLTASASKTGAAVPAGDAADNGFIATVTGSTNALAGDTVTTEWQYFSGGAWVPSGDLDLTYNRSLTDIFLQGSTDTPALTPILGDPYMLKRGTLRVRLHAVRTLNGQSCPADSAEVLVKALKAVDP